MLDRIRKICPGLPPAERRVGELVLKDPATFSRLPVAEIARRSGVSTPTVVRFCRSLGYDGLTDLKDRLAQEFAGPG